MRQRLCFEAGKKPRADGSQVRKDGKFREGGRKVMRLKEKSLLPCMNVRALFL